MSSRLISTFLGDTPIHLAGGDDEEPKLVWKVVLRTGTWKLRPGPGGVKLNAPLKIFRDQAPKGHISMTELVKSFEGDEKGPAKEHVTVPMAHVDGTMSDGGFVRKLVIQDVPGEDGAGVKESLLWAGMDITDSELRRKLDEKSLRGVSGGILFDYERTEDAKKFDQVLSHVMVTNSPWINGTGDFHDKLPEGIMASEPEDLPVGEVEFESRVTETPEELPVVHLDHPAPPAVEALRKPGPSFRQAQEKIQQALLARSEHVMSSLALDKRDCPTFSITDVTLTDEGGEATIESGYSSGADSWVVGFKYDAQGEVELDPFAEWTPVEAPEERETASPTTPPSARPAGRHRLLSDVKADRHHSLIGVGLQEAQAARAERTGLGAIPTTTGGHMGRITDLLSGVELSDEQREALLAEERRVASLEESESQRRERERHSEVAVYCGSPDGNTPGKLDELGLGDPGIKKYVRNALLSDDGGPAIELSEHLADGRSTSGESKTATELLKGFIDILPKDESGKVSLSDQARRLPDDPKPPVDNEPAPEDPKANAEALLAELHEQGFGADLVMDKGA